MNIHEISDYAICADTEKLKHGIYQIHCIVYYNGFHDPNTHSYRHQTIGKYKTINQK